VAPSSVSLLSKELLLPIFVGGGVAGTLDLILAFNAFGRGMPRGIASGLLGQSAFRGGLATWILGIFLHFLIAFSAAAIYCLSSRRLTFLRDHFFVCGMFFGIATFLFMNLIVLPLSALPHKSSTFTRGTLIHGLLVHMFMIGLPISFSARKLSK
jgi:hypothetical protein